MTEGQQTAFPTRVRIQFEGGSADIELPPGLPMLNFIMYLKGVGYLLLVDPPRIVPWHSVNLFTEVSSTVQSPLAAWSPNHGVGGMA